jgi:hypothetical protein
MEKDLISQVEIVYLLNESKIVDGENSELDGICSSMCGDPASLSERPPPVPHGYQETSADVHGSRFATLLHPQLEISCGSSRPILCLSLCLSVAWGMAKLEEQQKRKKKFKPEMRKKGQVENQHQFSPLEENHETKINKEARKRK